MTKGGFDIERIITDSIDTGFMIHDRLGPGLMESAYEALFEALMKKRGYRVERQSPISLQFDELVLPDVYRVDIIVERRLIVELKSVEQLAPVHSKQLLTYLRVTGLPVGLLMNFGGVLFKDGVKRIINNRSDYVAAIENASWHRQQR